MTRDEERAIEWDCQKLWREYYYHVDHREFEQAAALFTTDIDWTNSMGVVLSGREELLKGLYGALGDGTIRHVLTNMVVEVVDEDHANARAYNSIYYTKGVKFEEHDGPIPFEGPHRTGDNYTEFLRTEEGWRISKRRSNIVFRRNPEERVGLEIWSEKAGKMEK